MGGDAGPVLDAVGSTLDAEQILSALVDPGARLAPGFGTVRVKLNDGRQLVGVLQHEDKESVVLKEGNDNLQTISKGDILERKNSPSSMFNMAGVLTKSEIRDLVAFLGSLKGEEQVNK